MQQIDVTQLMFAPPPGGDEFDGGEACNENAIFFDYLTKAYSAFLAGDDNFETLERELASSFEVNRP